MTDLETRLVAALEAGAAGAPAADGLAAGARRRRARRRTRSVVGVVVAVLMVVVPGGLLLSRDGLTPPDVVAPVDPPAWRTETWEGLAVDVPGDWGYGDACDGGSDPVVDVPDGERRSPECTGRPGVQFFDSALFDSTLGSGRVVAGEDGTWVGYYAWIARGGGQDPAVWVTADDRETVQRVLDSAHPVSGADWRTETWGDLTLQVPADWADGEICGSTGPPVVSRPTGRSGLCSGRRTGLGVRFFGSALSDFIAPILEARRRAVQVGDDLDGLFPRGAWIAWASVRGDDAVFVVTAEEALTQRIVDSVRKRSGRQ